MKTWLAGWTTKTARGAAFVVLSAPVYACSNAVERTPERSNGSGAAAYGVGMSQSQKASAPELTMTDVAELVANAVERAGGLEFIQDGQTVVLKPNLPTFYRDAGSNTANPTVNGVSAASGKPHWG